MPYYDRYRGRNKRNLYCRLKLRANANRAGGSWGKLRKLLGSKMPLDWLKIGLNSGEKITLLSLRIPLETNMEIQFSSYKLQQPSA